jgi:hypothetical protein
MLITIAYNRGQSFSFYLQHLRNLVPNFIVNLISVAK